MRDDLVSLRVLAVSAAAPEADLLRQGGAMASMPVDIVAAHGGSESGALVRSGDIDLVLLDSGLPGSDQDVVVKACRDAPKPPFVIHLSKPGIATVAGVDAVLPKPQDPGEAQALIERCIRVLVPARVLIVDDSSTMRAIVRKILGASRFPLEFTDASSGADALDQIRNASFDIVFLDYNMPGLDGLATLAELRQISPDLKVVVMTSVEDSGISQRAREAGAAAFLKKPFFPADIDAVLRQVYGLAAPQWR